MSESSSLPLHVQSVLELLFGLQRAKDREGWIACCPAHADRDLSLSLHIEDTGRLRLHCSAGCSESGVWLMLGRLAWLCRCP